MKGTTVILVLALSSSCYCFPAVGVPPVKHSHPEVPAEAVCESMSVGHGYPAQNSESPYTINLSETKVAPGKTIEITIASKDGNEPFRGLLVQGRCGNTPVGSFIGTTLSEGSKYYNCGTGEKNAYSFITTDGDKYKDVITWQAPQESQDCPIVFYVSTVKTYNTYWVKQKSEQSLTVSSS